LSALPQLKEKPLDPFGLKSTCNHNLF